MRRSSRIIFAATAVGVWLGVGQIVSVAQGKTAPLMGVWKVVEVTRTAGPNAGTMTNPQPGIAIFTAGHYAIESVDSAAPRPELPPPDQRTDKQRAEAFGPFTANAGTYEIHGNEVTLRPMVAKNPSNMKEGIFQVETFRLEGKNTLWLVLKANNNGPEQNPMTIKLTRIE